MAPLPMTFNHHSAGPPAPDAAGFLDALSDLPRAIVHPPVQGVELANPDTPRRTSRADGLVRKRYHRDLERSMPRVLDGVAIASAIKLEVAEEVKKMAAQGIRPGLAVVLVGNVAASEIFVRD